MKPTKLIALAALLAFLAVEALPAATEMTHTNRLAKEKSPYLLESGNVGVFLSTRHWEWEEARPYLLGGDVPREPLVTFARNSTNPAP